MFILMMLVKLRKSLLSCADTIMQVVSYSITLLKLLLFSERWVFSYNEMCLWLKGEVSLTVWEMTYTFQRTRRHCLILHMTRNWSVIWQLDGRLVSIGFEGSLAAATFLESSLEFTFWPEVWFVMCGLRNVLFASMWWLILVLNMAPFSEFVTCVDNLESLSWWFGHCRCLWKHVPDL